MKVLKLYKDDKVSNHKFKKCQRQGLDLVFNTIYNPLSKLILNLQIQFNLLQILKLHMVLFYIGNEHTHSDNAQNRNT